jgi:L-aminopeptidase/D-esterase-like protein
MCDEQNTFQQMFFGGGTVKNGMDKRRPLKDISTFINHPQHSLTKLRQY